MTMLPLILDRSSIFVKRLESFASSGQSFSLVHLAANLTFDIISSVTMDQDFGAQSSGELGGFMSTYHELLGMYTSEQMDLPWFLAPRVEWKKRQLSNRIRATLRKVVHEAFANRAKATRKSRSILSLSLQDVDTDDLPEPAVDEACDQLCSFLFAGHDTTSILISWMFYELSRTPHALQALRSELDDLFGPGRRPSPLQLPRSFSGALEPESTVPASKLTCPQIITHPPCVTNSSRQAVRSSCTACPILPR